MSLRTAAGAPGIIGFLLLARVPAGAAEPTAAKPAAEQAPKVDLKVNYKEQRVDVLVDGQPFTSYDWRPSLKKPVLYPIRAASGAFITRGFPEAPRPEEATDHPHHLGLWLNYGNVDGVDFWNNSDKRDGKGDKKFGSVVHQRIKVARGGKGQARLEVACDWVGPDGKVMLVEDTAYVFSAAEGRRVIERTTSLRAARGPVTLPDNKEGVFGLRLARELEHPGEKNPAGTGKYRSSEGIEGKDVWGTRGRWMMLEARQGDRPLTIAMLDHPGNPGHPTHWHARPWGLFAANNLGQAPLSKNKLRLDYKLAKGQSAEFRYRVLVLGKQLTPEEMESEYKSFTSAVGARAQR